MKNIFSLIIIILSFTAIFMFGKPLNDEVKTLRAEVSEYNNALDNSTELEKTRDSLIDIYGKISKEDKQRLDSFLPNNANNIDLILEIQKIASEKGVFLKEIKFDAIDVSEKVPDKEQGQIKSSPIVAVEGTQPYNIFNLEFTVEGNYQSFIAFAKEVEMNLRIINIKSVSFSTPTVQTTKIKDAKEDKIQNPDFYEFTLKVETYWLKN